MPTPYIGFTNDTLNKLLDVKEGDLVHCPHCAGHHPLEPSDGGSNVLMFYRCGETRKSYLASINGKLIAGVKSDISGTL